MARKGADAQRRHVACRAPLQLWLALILLPLDSRVLDGAGRGILATWC